MTELTRTDDGIYVLHLGVGDVRFTPEIIDAIDAALHEVEAATAPAALVTTAGGKVWHNGLDLEYMATLGDRFVDYIADVQRLLARFLTLPVPTVAAVQGHAFAGGAMMALTHDVRVMRRDRGFLCLPEIDLGMPFTDGMSALLHSKLAQPARHRMAVLGERVGGETAFELGVVEHLAESDEAVEATAMEVARSLAPKASRTITALRRCFYGAAIDLLGGITE